MLTEDSFAHKGLRKFWNSGGTDISGIPAEFEATLREMLVHLNTAHNLNDIHSDYAKQKKIKRLKGLKRYSMRVNGNWRLTFKACRITCYISEIMLEDYH